MDQERRLLGRSKVVSGDKEAEREMVLDALPSTQTRWGIAKCFSCTRETRLEIWTVSGQDFFDELVSDKKRLEIMFLRADGEPWGKSHQRRPMQEACKKAKISPPLPFKALRTTYGSLLAMEGVPLQVIGAALGHKGTRITEQHYAHLLPDHIADTIRDKLPTFSNKKSKVRRLKQNKR